MYFIETAALAIERKAGAIGFVETGPVPEAVYLINSAQDNVQLGENRKQDADPMRVQCWITVCKLNQHLVFVGKLAWEVCTILNLTTKDR